MKRLVFRLCVALFILPASAEKTAPWDNDELTDLINLAIGEGDEKALKKCLSILEPPAKTGDVEAQARLGGTLCALFANGYGTPADEKKGLEWAEKAAKKGHATACQILGATIRDNPKTAIYWMRAAADKGLASAQWQLGSWYEYGKHDIKKDPAKAAQWYLKAANRDEPGAQIALARLYREGKGVKLDFQQENEWLHRAAKHERYDYPRYMLGRNYEEGHGVKQDLKQAVSWYLEAAKYKNGNACVALAWCYTKGQGVEADFEKALHYLHLSEQLPCNEHERARRDEIKTLLEALGDLNL